MGAGPDPNVSRVEAVLESLRRGHRQLTRNPRATIEVAVKQLLGGVAGHQSRSTTGRTYRVDDLARAGGTTVRNVRAYQERGLLHPPRRSGRTALFDDTHLSRLKIITSMLERGYTGAHILEMLNAWEHGQDLASVLGLESALVPARVDDQPVTMTVTQARELAGGAEPYAQLTEAGLIEPAGSRVRVLRPALLAAFAEMRRFGLANDTLVDLHRRIEPIVDQISQLLVNTGAEHLAPRIVGDDPPTPEQVEDLVATLARFRTLAMTSVTATLALSIESTIEGLLADYLAHFVRTTEATG